MARDHRRKTYFVRRTRKQILCERDPEDFEQAPAALFCASSYRPSVRTCYSIGVCPPIHSPRTCGRPPVFVNYLVLATSTVSSDHTSDTHTTTRTLLLCRTIRPAATISLSNVFKKSMEHTVQTVLSGSLSFS